MQAIRNSLQEQETTINLDYFEGKVYLYTSRNSVAQKLEKELGKPTSIETTEKGNITGVNYERYFTDKDVKKLLSKMILIAKNGQNKK